MYKEADAEYRIRLKLCAEAILTQILNYFKYPSLL